MMETADKYCCRTLPMRNWYFNWNLSNGYFFSYSSDITYEELILSASEISPARDFKKGRTLPMRNWYSYGLVENYLFLRGFHPSDITYEELIHWVMFLASFSFSSASCRTLPMRNWYVSENVLRYISICLSMSDITYEELIHFISVNYISSFSSCRTLPMRNWYDEACVVLKN